MNQFDLFRPSTWIEKGLLLRVAEAPVAPPRKRKSVIGYLRDGGGSVGKPAALLLAAKLAAGFPLSISANMTDIQWSGSFANYAINLDDFQDMSPEKIANVGAILAAAPAFEGDNVDPPDYLF